MKIFIVLLSIAFGAAQASVLSTTASGMSAGTWAEVPQTNIGAVMAGGAHAGNLSPYAMSGAWDSTAKRLHFVGGDHGCTNNLSIHVYYDAASNAWTSLGQVSGFSSCHEYDHLTIDQKNRRLYFSPYGGTIAVSRYNLASNGPWSSIGNAPATGYVNITRGLDWFEGPLTGAGSDGALLIYNCGAANGELLVYDPEKSQWIADIKGFGGSGTYHGFCEYSRVHKVAIMGGGNANGKKVWRLNADRTITALTDAPVDLGVQRANVVPDPVTGNFLAMGYGQLWNLDPRGSGTWSQQTGTRVPPSAVGNPGSPDLNSVISAALPDYGVDMYVTCRAANCNMYLYKHANPGNAELESGLPAPNGTAFSGPSIVYNIRGRMVARLDEGATWSRSGVPAGVYMIVSGIGKNVYLQKMVVVR